MPFCIQSVVMLLRSSHLFDCNVIIRQAHQFSIPSGLCKLFSVEQGAKHSFLLSLAVSFISLLHHYLKSYVRICAVKKFTHFVELTISGY